jgi:cytochrome c oxidase subunit 2
MSATALLPLAASAFASRVDALFFTLVAVTGAVALAVIAVVIVFAVRFRAASAANRDVPPDGTRQRRSRRIEIAWALAPLLVFLVFFGWGADLYFDYATPPEGAALVFVVAKQWMWEAQHSNGRREIGTLHVARGTAVKVVMTSQDVIHSVFLPEFRVKHDVLPGRYSVLWFLPTRAGVFHLFCAEYCGGEHSTMRGEVVVLEPPAYQQWLNAGSVQPSLAQRGEERFRQYGCSGCHDANSLVHAPPLAGLYGNPVQLADGSRVRADERYLRDAILLPGKEVVAGYAPIMPSFAGQIDEERLIELIAYIRSLGTAAGATP